MRLSEAASLTLDAVQVDRHQRFSLVSVVCTHHDATRRDAVLIGRDGGWVTVKGRSYSLGGLKCINPMFSAAEWI